MAKVHADKHETTTNYIFFCPGCKCSHVVDARWTFNGDLDKPTFSPSLLCNPDHPASRCHTFIRDGNIEFLSDCFHELAGTTVEIPEWEGQW